MEETVFVNGGCQETASLTAMSVMEVADVIWILQREEVGRRAVGE